MRWIWMPWRRAFDYSGRAPRREYWLYVAGVVVILFVYLLLIGTFVPDAENEVDAADIDRWLGFATIILLLGLMLVGLSAAVRRLHDHDKSGWFILLAAVPAVGWIFFLIMMLTPGTDGPNSYGINPRDEQRDMNEVAGIFA